MQTYEVNLKWTGKRKGVLSSPALPYSIEVATPPDFPKGMEGIWSPEHLFVASINSCLMSTFLNIAENSKLEFASFECNSVCQVDLDDDNKYVMTEITLKPKVVVHFSKKPERAKHILEMSEKACFILSAIKTPILFEPEIIVEHSLIQLGDLF
jgi:organic hydroperoxide reductase OsmC/OhrA